MSEVRAALVDRRLRVVAIEGEPALERPVADLRFGSDGRVSGCATVNRLAGGYELAGDRLVCGPLASTMMAGPPAAMEQEQRLHRVLTRPLTVVVRDDAVELLSEDGPAVTLVADPEEPTV